MDNLRGNFGALDASDLGPGLDSLGLEPAVDFDEPEEDHDPTPPPSIGTDERRMQVRAYNFWASLLDNCNFPSIEDLDPDNLPDFGPHSVLLDFSCGIDNPEVSYLGDKLAEECDAGSATITRLSDVPARSLLSRITDHYMQIIANQAPIGFEAEFVNQRGATILYRGILLPFSSDDDTIDFIYGVINWKEMAEADAADELLLEVDQALDAPEEPRRTEDSGMVDWADGPAAFDIEEPLELTHTVDDLAPVAGLAATDIAVADPAEMELADWLAVAREMAQTAKSSEERTRASLYEAVSRAYDFALAAFETPAEFAELLADSGLTRQDRAPMTPVVKLVFGGEYDKTRLTEYAAVLSWAKRNAVERGALAEFLRNAEGGLKGIIAAERDFRRDAEGTPPAPKKTRGPKKSIARKLRAIEPRRFESLASEGEEFALVMVRRTESGDVVMLGEVPGNTALIEKAARELIG
ncbi:hypothetical protein [Aurantiacibacter gangjinensis]|uniref:Uncharacterized protein n=1 Tax=Aurantiacibacter gangjinensis TaxID=502682 RepID=A0A0G9MQC7_9SPHN|nr:hypothetical protein [Aurantiacibacter gangjinensis]APE27438.1 hypothetical protein BMF35_a0609 [Aurantiacibacter gangjinensis]KLE31508.1 hypothetical protein AAW01_08035 [Aurantiacibacter gangjinensis]